MVAQAGRDIELAFYYRNLHGYAVPNSTPMLPWDHSDEVIPTLRPESSQAGFWRQLELYCRGMLSRFVVRESDARTRGKEVSPHRYPGVGSFSIIDPSKCSSKMKFLEPRRYSQRCKSRARPDC